MSADAKRITCPSCGSCLYLETPAGNLDCGCGTVFPVPLPLVVMDNITGRAVSREFDSLTSAERTCYGMNLDAGPGGRYGVGVPNAAQQ